MGAADAAAAVHQVDARARVATLDAPIAGSAALPSYTRAPRVDAGAVGRPEATAGVAQPVLWAACGLWRRNLDTTASLPPIALLWW